MAAPEKKIVRGKTGTPIQFKSNIFPLSVQKKTPYFKYDFRVKIHGKKLMGREYTTEITKPSQYYDDDCRKETNVRVLHELAKLQPFLKKSLIYDRAAILFSLEELVKSDEELTFDLPRKALGPSDLFDTVQKVTVALKKATDRYQITSDDITSAAEADFVEGGSKSIYQLLNIATSQCVVDHQHECSADSKARIYILKPGDYGLEKETALGDGQILRPSIKKSVKTIENVLKDGKVVAPIPAIAIDVSRTAMHMAELISTKLNRLGHNHSEYQRMPMIGLKVKKTYGNRAILTICAFSRETIANCTVKLGEKEEKMKLAAYIKKQYKIVLKETHLPAVLDRKGNVYPPELLMAICEQVKPEQNTAATMRAMIMANATPGDVRMSQIASLTSVLHLADKKAESMGVQLQRNAAALKVAGRMLPPKKLTYGNKQTSIGFDRNEKALFYAPRLTKWALIVTSQKDYRQTIDTLQKKGKQVGMTIAQPSYQAVTTAKSVATELGKAASMGCTYAMIISDVEGDHEAIKAVERDYGIVTQEVRGRTTDKAHGDTGANLVLKMNIKNGGLNHIVGDEPLLLKDDTLIIALVFDHPVSQKKDIEDGKRPTCPAVVGFGSNAVPIIVAGKAIPESSQNFTEKFAYANPREWKVEGEPTFTNTVSELIKHEIAAFKTGRSRVPVKIILYVYGVSDAERGYWSYEGKNLVNDVCHSFNPAYNPAKTIITLSAEGCERFVAEGKPVNLKGPDPRTGFIVDSVVVNPKINEWFQQTARALKGTPRTIKYTLVSEPAAEAAKLTMDQLQMLTWSLSHLHQYCLGTIGLPAPARIAVDAAKRARAIFGYRKTRGAYDLKELNETLGFKSTTASTTTRTV